jgi:rod shape-determining protein MreC
MPLYGQNNSTFHANSLRVSATSFALFCLALFLTSYSAKKPEIAQSGKYLFAEVVSPFQRTGSYLHGGVGGVWSEYVALREIRTENTALRSRLAALEAENAKIIEAQQENERLRNLLGIVERSTLRGVAASVIGHNPSSWAKTITIDRGTRDGIRTGMAVIETQGVVGQVISAGRTSAEVMLITDHTSGVDSIIQRTRARGVVEGSGGRFCRLRYVLKEEDLKVGDVVITSGMDGVYPKGLLIGIVSELDGNKRGLFQMLEVAPTVDFSRLENVLVVTSAAEQELELTAKKE